MLSYVLRCSRAPFRVGKVVRHAMRHHWGLSHHAARVIWHGAVAGGVVTCVAVPVWLVVPAPPVMFAPAPVSTPVPGEQTATPIAEPSGILVFGVGVVALLVLRETNKNRSIGAVWKS